MHPLDRRIGTRRSRHARFSAATLCAALLLAFGSAPASATTFAATLYQNALSAPTIFASAADTSPVTIPQTTVVGGSGNYFTYTGEAFAGRGISDVSMTLHNQAPDTRASSGLSTAAMNFTDIVFSSAGGSGGTANVRMNLLLSGLFDASVYEYQLWTSIQGNTWFIWNSVAEPTVVEGLLSDQLLKTTFWSVPLDVPITIGISHGINVVDNRPSLHPGPTTRSASVRFALVPFDVPGGVTVNSADATIVDNVFVPEPGTAGLFAGALLALGARRRTALP